MNICFITKYPPIQGGVSMHCYWAARGLARRGHKVFVVTNANEVESTFRIYLSEADKADDSEYARTFPESSGLVKVHSTEPPDRSQMYYVPLNNPTVTRLATIATNLIRTEECQVIFSYYLEPYGLAAHLASHWTGIPYVFKHAGSDLNRLMPLEDLETAYLEVLASANRNLSQGRSRKQLLSYGVSEERINSDVAFSIPTEYFHPNAPSLDINDLMAELAQSAPAEGQMQLSGAPLEKSLPVLGIYGKLGEYKGSFDLIHAMAQLIKQNFPFYLVALSHGWQEHRFRQLIEQLGIGEYVRFLPFLPHWKLPGFIRSCTAITFLERDFPIATHTPTIPTEVIACGKCLILSKEVARKQLFRTQIRNFKNIVSVSDPKQHDNLAACLRFALENTQRADEIGRQGFQDFDISKSHEKYIDRLESVLMEVASEKPVVRKLVAHDAVPKGGRDSIEMTVRLFPYTRALLSEGQEELIRQGIAGTALGSGIEDRSELAIELGQKLLSILSRDGDTRSSPIYEVCRYECKVHEWAKNSPPEKELEVVEVSFSVDKLGPLYPSIRGDMEVVQFTVDVEQIITAIEERTTIPRGEEPIKVLFHSGSGPIRINEPTAHLLTLVADGSVTLDEIFMILVDDYQCEDKASQGRLLESCLSALEGLYWEGIVEFRSASLLAKTSAEAQDRTESSYA